MDTMKRFANTLTKKNGYENKHQKQGGFGKLEFTKRMAVKSQIVVMAGTITSNKFAGDWGGYFVQKFGGKIGVFFVLPGKWIPKMRLSFSDRRICDWYGRQDSYA